MTTSPRKLLIIFGDLMQVHFLLGKMTVSLMLIAAAFAKSVTFLTPGQDDLASLNKPFLTIALINYEIFIGIWLISGIAPRTAWISVTLTYCVFLVYLCLQLAAQESSCNCLGRYSPSPALMAMIDLITLVFLFSMGIHEWRSDSVRPNLGSVARIVSQFTLVMAGLALLHCFVISLTKHWIGTEEKIAALLRGQPIVIRPNLLEIGSQDAGHIASFDLEITNISKQPIHIVGVSSSCLFELTSQQRVMVLPNDITVISVTIKWPHVDGEFAYQHSIYVNLNGELSIIAFQYRGCTNAKQSS